MSKIDIIFEKILKDINSSFITEAIIKNGNKYGIGSRLKKRVSKILNFESNELLHNDKSAIKDLLAGSGTISGKQVNGEPQNIDVNDIHYLWCKPEVDAKTGSPTGNLNTLSKCVAYWLSNYKNICQLLQTQIDEFNDETNEKKFKKGIEIGIGEYIARYFANDRIGQVYGLMLDMLYDDKIPKLMDYAPSPRKYTYYRVDLFKLGLTKTSGDAAIEKAINTAIATKSDAILKFDPVDFKDELQKTTAQERESLIPDKNLLTDMEYLALQKIFADNSYAKILYQITWDYNLLSREERNRMSSNQIKCENYIKVFSNMNKSIEAYASKVVANDKAFAVASDTDFTLPGYSQDDSNAIKLSTLLKIKAKDLVKRYEEELKSISYDYHGQIKHVLINAEALGIDPDILIKTSGRKGPNGSTKYIDVFVKRPTSGIPELKHLFIPDFDTDNFIA